jgi:hypothetical protein
MNVKLDSFLKGMGSLLVLAPTEASLRTIQMRSIGDYWVEVGGYITEAMYEQAREGREATKCRPQEQRRVTAGR